MHSFDLDGGDQQQTGRQGSINAARDMAPYFRWPSRKIKSLMQLEGPEVR